MNVMNVIELLEKILSVSCNRPISKITVFSDGLVYIRCENEEDNPDDIEIGNITNLLSEQEKDLIRGRHSTDL